MSIHYLPFSVGTITIAAGQKVVVATAAPGLGNNCLPGDTLQIGRDKSFTVGATGAITDAGFELVEDFAGYINDVGVFTAGSIAVGVPYKLFKGPGWAETTRLNSNAMALMTAARNGFVVESVSTVAIGAGEKIFAVSEIAPVYAGAWVRAVSKASPLSHWMWGKVSEVAGGTVKVDVSLYAGAGSRSDWRIMLSSERGPVGGAVAVPGVTVVDHVAGWNAADGSALKDLGTFPSLITAHGIPRPGVTVPNHIVGWDAEDGSALKDMGPLSALVAPYFRERLTAARTYYVRLDGSNGNDGRSNAAGVGGGGAGAFATIQYAINVVAALDLSIYNVEIIVVGGLGTYPAGFAFDGMWVGSGTVQLTGDVVTPSNVTVQFAAANLFNVTSRAKIYIRGFKLVTTSSGSLIQAEGGHIVLNGNMEYGQSGFYQIVASKGGVVDINANYSISGNAGIAHWQVYANGHVRCVARTITLIGTPNFTQSFVEIALGGAVECHANTFVGAGTGRRYLITRCGSARAAVSQSYFPGSTFTGDTTSGNNVITNVSSTTGLFVGTGIIGPGIQAGTTISAIGVGTVTLSLNATATAAGVTLNQTGLIDATSYYGN